MQWQWSDYEALSKTDVHAMLRLRQQVFVIEQNCIYEDADDLDVHSWHLLGWDTDTSGAKTLAAYLRLVPAGKKFVEPSIGRVLVAEGYRGQGVGRELMEQGLVSLAKTLGKKSNRISAQLHLASFYGSLGYTVTSEPYDEDGIPHVEMLHG